MEATGDDHFRGEPLQNMEAEPHQLQAPAAPPPDPPAPVSNYVDPMEQRSHIAIIQMAPPAPGSAKGNVNSVNNGNTNTVTAVPASVVKTPKSATSAQRGPRTGGGGPQQQENGSKKKRHHCTVRGCSYNTPHSKDLARHMRKHTGEKPYSCDRCSSSFSRYDKLVMHIRIHEGHRPFSCQFCNYAAVDSSGLRKHLRTHSNERPYKCQLCPYSSKDSSQLKVHLRSHTGDSPYLCGYAGCDAAFKTPSDLSRHTRCHTREKPYKCLYCDYRAAVKCNLNVHMKRHTNPPSQKKRKKPAVSSEPEINVVEEEDDEEFEPSAKEDDLPQQRSNPDLLPFQYACKLCSYKADTIESFTLHMEKSHPDSNFGLQARAKKTGRKTKRLHNFTEQRTFQCSSCNAAFVCEDSLRCHMRQHGTVPNKPANVDPEIYSPTPNRIRVLQNNDIPPHPLHQTHPHFSTSDHPSFPTEVPPHATSSSENEYVLQEVQKMPLVHSVITENPTVLGGTSSSGGGTIVQQQHYDPATGHTYVVTYNNMAPAEQNVDHVNLMYNQVHE